MTIRNIDLYWYSDNYFSPFCIVEELISIIGDIHDPATFVDAKSTCENEGKQLLMIKDREKENQVARHHLSE